MVIVQYCRDVILPEEYKSLPEINNLGFNNNIMHSSSKDYVTILDTSDVSNSIQLRCTVKHVPFITAMRICQTMGLSFGDFGRMDNLMRYLDSRNRLKFRSDATRSDKRNVFVTRHQNRYLYSNKWTHKKFEEIDHLYGSRVLINLEAFSFQELFELIMRCDEHVYYDGSLDVFIKPSILTKDLAARTVNKMPVIMKELLNIPIQYTIMRTPFKTKRNVLDNRCEMCKTQTRNVSTVKSYCRLADEIQAMAFICHRCLADSTSIPSSPVTETTAEEKMYVVKILGNEDDDAKFKKFAKEVAACSVTVNKTNTFTFSKAFKFTLMGTSNTVVIDHNPKNENKSINTKIDLEGNIMLYNMLEVLMQKIKTTFKDKIECKLGMGIRLWPGNYAKTRCSHAKCKTVIDKLLAENDATRVNLKNYLNKNPGVGCGQVYTYLRSKKFLDKRSGGMYDFGSDAESRKTHAGEIDLCVTNGSEGHFLNYLTDELCNGKFQVVQCEFVIRSMVKSEFNNSWYYQMNANLNKLIFIDFETTSLQEDLAMYDAKKKDKKTDGKKVEKKETGTAEGVKTQENEVNAEQVKTEEKNEVDEKNDVDKKVDESGDQENWIEELLKDVSEEDTPPPTTTDVQPTNFDLFGSESNSIGNELPPSPTIESLEREALAMNKKRELEDAVCSPSKKK